MSTKYQGTCDCCDTKITVETRNPSDLLWVGCPECDDVIYVTKVPNQ